MTLHSHCRVSFSIPMIMWWHSYSSHPFMCGYCFRYLWVEGLLDWVCGVCSLAWRVSFSILCELLRYTFVCRVSFSIPATVGRGNFWLLGITSHFFAVGYRKQYPIVGNVIFLGYFCDTILYNYDKRRTFQKREPCWVVIWAISRTECRASCKGNGYKWNPISQLYKWLKATFGFSYYRYRELFAKTRQRTLWHSSIVALLHIGVVFDTQHTIGVAKV